MANYKVGDKVLIKNGLKDWEHYGKVLFVDKMVCGKDCIRTISEVVEGDAVGILYRMKETGILLWSAEMFEKKVEEKKMKFKVGDIVRGNNATRYRITSNKMTKAKVLKVYDNGNICIEILEYKNSDCVGEKYGEYGGLEPQYFDLVTDKKKFAVGDILKVTENGLEKVNCIFVDDVLPEKSGKNIVVKELPDEKFGFKIGETVLYNGEERKILSFDTRGGNDFYVSGYTSLKPSFNDRPISENWEFAYGREIQHLPKERVPKVGDYAKITKFVYGAPVETIVKIEKVNPYRYSPMQFEYSYNGRKKVGIIGDGAELVPEDYKHVRVYTEAQIAEAERIVGSIFINESDNLSSYIRVNKNSISTRIIDNRTGKTTKGVSTCSQNDTFNLAVGKMISLLRALGREKEIPKWVYGE